MIATNFSLLHKLLVSRLSHAILEEEVRHVKDCPVGLPLFWQQVFERRNEAVVEPQETDHHSSCEPIWNHSQHFELSPRVLCAPTWDLSVLSVHAVEARAGAQSPKPDLWQGSGATLDGNKVFKESFFFFLSRIGIIKESKLQLFFLHQSCHHSVGARRRRKTYLLAYFREA